MEQLKATIYVGEGPRNPSLEDPRLEQYVGLPGNNYVVRFSGPIDMTDKRRLATLGFVVGLDSLLSRDPNVRLTKLEVTYD